MKIRYSATIPSQTENWQKSRSGGLAVTRYSCHSFVIFALPCNMCAIYVSWELWIVTHRNVPVPVSETPIFFLLFPPVSFIHFSCPLLNFSLLEREIDLGFVFEGKKSVSGTCYPFLNTTVKFEAKIIFHLNHAENTWCLPAALLCSALFHFLKSYFEAVFIYITIDWIIYKCLLLSTLYINDKNNLEFSCSWLDYLGLLWSLHFSILPMFVRSREREWLELKFLNFKCSPLSYWKTMFLILL